MHTASEDAGPPDACANCGAPLAGNFCAQCGQSRAQLRRPFLSLIGELAGDMFSLDGRLIRTLGLLYRRPGRVARDYVDGKRASYTPPVRLFLLVSLAFFSAMALSGARVIAIQTSEAYDAPGERDLMLQMELLRFGGRAEPVEFSDEVQANLEESAAGEGATALISRMTLQAAADPARVERGASAAAAQAIFILVGAFALLNALVHPRRRLIEHAVHSLYFHAAFLPALGAAAALSEFAERWRPAGVAAGLAMAAGAFAIVYLFDRGFYGSGRVWGALRAAFVILMYAAGAALLASVLAFVQII